MGTKMGTQLLKCPYGSDVKFSQSVQSLLFSFPRSYEEG